MRYLKPDGTNMHVRPMCGISGLCLKMAVASASDPRSASSVPGFPVGTLVVLAAGYESAGAAAGPLKPGNVGKVVENDGSDAPYKIEYNGSTVRAA